MLSHTYMPVDRTYVIRKSMFTMAWFQKKKKENGEPSWCLQGRVQPFGQILQTSGFMYSFFWIWKGFFFFLNLDLHVNMFKN